MENAISDSTSLSPPPLRKLPVTRRLCYSIGHVLNDLCASMWFSYLLIFYHKVIGLSNFLAGNLLLLGQIADALSTPFVGLEVDSNHINCGYGQRKTWHLIGTICVALSFCFLFILCPGCPNVSSTAQFVYYAPFIVIFQFGWAATQVSHLSLIPVLTDDESQRVELTSLRYAATVISNIAVYGTTWLLLDFDQESMGLQASIGIEDAPVFMQLVIIVVATGSCFSTVFHIGTKDEVTRLRSVSQTSSKKSWKDWLRSYQFYMVAIVYMSSRLFVNISQVYLPLYLDETLLLEKDFIARIPLIVYVSGFVTSFVMKPVNSIIGRRGTYILGSVMAIGASVWMYFDVGNQIYGVAVLLGISGSTLLVTSLSMVADLIGRNTESGAFVYGAMSFTDKLSNGIAVLTIQNLHPCVGCCVDCRYYFRDVMTFVLGGTAVLGVGIIFLTLLMVCNLNTEEPCMDKNSDERKPLLEDSQPSEYDSYSRPINNVAASINGS